MQIRRMRLTERPRRWLVHLVRGALIAAAVVIGLIASFAVVGPHFGYSYAVVKSGSMAPAYQPGSVILIGPTDPRAVRAGDVISYRAPSQSQSQIITHRVIEVRESSRGPQFVTQGDANQTPDTRAVEASELKGRVLLSVPWIGQLAALLQQQGLFFGVVVVCAALIVTGEVRNIAREVRRKRHEREQLPAPADGRLPDPWVPPWAEARSMDSSGGAGAVLGARWVRSGVISGLLALVLFWSMPHVSAQFTDSDATTSNAIRMRTYGTLEIALQTNASGGPFAFSISPAIEGNDQIAGCDTFSLANGGSHTCELLRPGTTYTIQGTLPTEDFTWDVTLDSDCVPIAPDPPNTVAATVNLSVAEVATCTFIHEEVPEPLDDNG
jgi:signal peptidase I